jgi:hypothetical protein
MRVVMNRVVLLSCFSIYSIMAQEPAFSPQAMPNQGPMPMVTGGNQLGGLGQPGALPAGMVPTPAMDQQLSAPVALPAAPEAKEAVTASAPEVKEVPAEPAVAPTQPTEAPAVVPATPEVPAAPMVQPEAGPSAPVPTEVPAAPVPPKEVAKEDLKQEDVAPEDFDTTKLKEYGGNWYFKQGWWQRAEREYEKARQVLDQIFESRMEYFERQSSLDRNLFDPFYQEIGFERGELNDVIDLLVDKIEEERKEEGMLDIKERTLLAKLEEEKSALEQLKLNSELVNKYDTAISNAISELLKQLNQARQYEQVAWQEFKAIAEDLNDVVARARFYAVKTQHKNIKNILEYLKGSFNEYFDKLEANAKKEVDLVKEGIKTLKTRGLDLKEQAKRLVEDEKTEKKVVAPEPQKSQEEPQAGFFMRLLTAIAGFFKSVWNFIFGWLYRF